MFGKSRYKIHGVFIYKQWRQHRK